jgi:hypothetical protein
LSFAFRIAPEYGRLQITSVPRCNKPSGQTFISPRPVITPGASDEAHPRKDIYACIVTSDLFSAGRSRNERFGTLDRKELKDRISAEDWKVADPDNDKTISKDEYLAFVEVAFKRANPDNDGTIDAKELKTPAGRALLRLLIK